jgi:hypothetical protein
MNVRGHSKRVEARGSVQRGTKAVYWVRLPKIEVHFTME